LLRFSERDVCIVIKMDDLHQLARVRIVEILGKTCMYTIKSNSNPITCSMFKVLFDESDSNENHSVYCTTGCAFR